MNPLSSWRPFSWLEGKERQTPARTAARRPFPRDMTGGLVANEDMLKGLYHGTWQGLQFASALAYTPIAVPVQMMGLPTPKSDDELTQAVLNEITAMMAERIPKLNRSELLLGTTWRWPRFDAKSATLVWEEIPDAAIGDVLVDIVTGQPAAILTDEQISLSIGENRIIIVQRKRQFDRRRVDVKWFGQKPDSVQDYTATNVSGVLPIPFAHDAEEGELRGFSALARIIRDLKDYHDTDYRVSEILTKFLPKQLQQTDDVGQWCLNNLGTNDPASLTGYDVAGTDLIVNKKDEDTDFKYLADDATAGHAKHLERKYWKIVEGSGIPEIFWGVSLSGNHADGDNQTQKGVTYVESIRQEMNRPYAELYAASLRLLGIARGENYKPFDMAWNRLETVSAEVKAKIFLADAQAIGRLSETATWTKDQLWNYWTRKYPETKPGEFDAWVKGISEMAVHKQFVGETYGDGLEDFQAKADSDTDKDGVK